MRTSPTTISGWWFQTWLYFPFHIWDVILPIDLLIFFKMGTLHHQPDGDSQFSYYSIILSIFQYCIPCIYIYIYIHIYMAVCQNLVPLVNTKIAGKWMFIPLKMVFIGIDPYPYIFQSIGRSTTLWVVR